MYGALWRFLPGPTWLKVVWCLLLVAAFVFVCFQWVFPALEPLLPFSENTVGP